MLLDETRDWTTIDAYVRKPPSRWRLVAARLDWWWLERQLAAKRRRERRELERFQHETRYLPENVLKDIGLR